MQYYNEEDLNKLNKEINLLYQQLSASKQLLGNHYVFVDQLNRIFDKLVDIQRSFSFGLFDGNSASLQKKMTKICSNFIKTQKKVIAINALILKQTGQELLRSSEDLINVEENNVKDNNFNH